MIAKKHHSKNPNRYKSSMMALIEKIYKGKTLESFSSLHPTILKVACETKSGESFAQNSYGRFRTANQEDQEFKLRKVLREVAKNPFWILCREWDFESVSVETVTFQNRV